MRDRYEVTIGLASSGVIKLYSEGWDAEARIDINQEPYKTAGEARSQLVYKLRCLADAIERLSVDSDN
jgi:hypothetical protein